jgi:hypothetical protein
MTFSSEVPFNVFFSATALFSFSSFEPKTTVTLPSFASVAMFEITPFFASSSIHSAS